MPYTAAVLTISDATYQGKRQDLSGPAVVELLKKRNYDIVVTEIVPDEQPQIETALLRACEQAQLVVTTGGTGIAARDVTPEATITVCDRLIEGIPEYIRAKSMEITPRAVLSRAACGTRNTSLILNLPGSPQGAVESLSFVIEIIPHALELLQGNTNH